MLLTYPLVVTIPGQIAFGAVIVSNLLIASSCAQARDRVRNQGESVIMSSPLTFSFQLY